MKILVVLCMKESAVPAVLKLNATYSTKIAENIHNTSKSNAEITIALDIWVFGSVLKAT